MPLAVLAYDGSDDARRAIETAGKLVGGRAVVVHVWASPVPPIAGALPASATLTPEELAEMRAVAEREAQAKARDGAEIARRAGFEATSELRTGALDREVWHALLDVAEERDADLIVLGRHEHSAIRDLLLRTVADGVVHHAHRPVLVVPTPPEE